MGDASTKNPLFAVIHLEPEADENENEEELRDLEGRD